MNKTIRILTALAALLLIGVTAVAFASCDKNPDTSSDTTAEATPAPTEDPTEPPTEEPTEEATTEEETTEEATTEEVTTEAPIKDQLGLNIKDEDMIEAMQNIFSGTTSVKETVMFLDKGDVKSLLYPIKSIVSVTSYDGKTTYEEGKDYVVEDGKLKVTENSSIKVITSETYYNGPSTGTCISDNATGKYMYWGESQMKQWQIAVTYTHDAAWEGYVQESQLDVYQNFVKKLIAGEDVTVFFYGDSITYGACSTYAEGVQPKQGAYAMLFTEALADLFGYKVKYVNTGLAAGMSCHTVPNTEYGTGDRGTITYVNTAIGGWNSNDGVTNFDKFVKQQVEKHGCDLFVLAYGMNDGFDASTTRSNSKTIIDGVLEIKPEAAIMMVSTMTPHTNSNWDTMLSSIKQQERQLDSLAKQLRKDDKAVAVACVHSVSKAIQEHKTFNDYSGNNINHPNDWFYRVYAQTLLQTLIGYENMN